LKTIMVLPGSTVVTAKNWPNRYMEYALHGKYKIIKYLLTITQSTKLGKGDKNKAETYSTELGSNST